MAQIPVNLKLFSEIKELLMSENDKMTAKKPGPPVGSFTLFNFPAEPKNSFDEVYPGIVLGKADVAVDGPKLKDLGITHLVNASMGKKVNQTDTDDEFYKEFQIKFHGIPALDIFTFKMSPYFEASAEFIDKALQENGKVYVHCKQGISRSATIVLSFLMHKRKMELKEAVTTVRGRRAIFPNDGFLKQLCYLNDQLYHPDQVRS